MYTTSPYANMCRGWNQPPHQSVRCPPGIEYPPPPKPTEILFIGWNPPGSVHFWSPRERGQDKLRDSLEAVLHELGWPKGGNFLEQFLARKLYFVHAVPCWKEAKFPTNRLENSLVSTCATNVLNRTLSAIGPKRICALGRVPHMALRALFPDAIPQSCEYQKGWQGSAGPYKVILTCFPNTWPVNRKDPHGPKHRDCTVAALRRWWT